MPAQFALLPYAQPPWRVLPTIGLLIWPSCDIISWLLQSLPTPIGSSTNSILTSLHIQVDEQIMNPNSDHVVRFCMVDHLPPLHLVRQLRCETRLPHNFNFVFTTGI